MLPCPATAFLEREGRAHPWWSRVQDSKQRKNKREKAMATGRKQPAYTEATFIWVQETAKRADSSPNTHQRSTCRLPAYWLKMSSWSVSSKNKGIAYQRCCKQPVHCVHPFINIYLGQHAARFLQSSVNKPPQRHSTFCTGLKLTTLCSHIVYTIGTVYILSGEYERMHNKQEKYKF